MLSLARVLFWAGGHPYYFTVRLQANHSNHLVNETWVRNIRDIIEQQKPAFCTYDLEILPALERETKS
jgi:hypothetical protein